VEHQGKGGDECLSDRLLRVIDAKRTASNEANAQILALICDKYDDFCASSLIFCGPGSCLNIVSNGGGKRTLDRFACQRNTAEANRPAVAISAKRARHRIKLR